MPSSKWIDHCDYGCQLDKEGYHLLMCEYVYGGGPLRFHSKILSVNASLTYRYTEPKHCFMEKEDHPDTVLFDEDDGKNIDLDISLSHPWSISSSQQLEIKHLHPKEGKTEIVTRRIMQHQNGCITHQTSSDKHFTQTTYPSSFKYSMITCLGSLYVCITAIVTGVIKGWASSTRWCSSTFKEPVKIILSIISNLREHAQVYICTVCTKCVILLKGTCHRTTVE